jgi:CheY-like chemotaxis protein
MMKRIFSVLVCDDNIDFADTVSALLSTSGCLVTTTYRGLDALVAARSVKLDAALLDIGLPDMDGYEVARNIRAMPSGASIMLVAITAYGTQEAKQEASDAGFNIHMTKPIDFPVLETVLNKIR